MSTFMMKTMVFGMNCKANIICRASFEKLIGIWDSCLAGINEQAEEMFFWLVKAFVEKKYDRRTQKHRPNG